MAYKDNNKNQEVKKKIKERNPLTKKQKTLICIEVFVVLGLAALIGFFIHLRLNKPDVIDTTIDVSYSKEHVASNIDEQFLPLMEFQLYGKYEATDNSGSDKYYFSFGAENDFDGYSSAEPDDFGSYNISSDGTTYYLNINCLSAKDRYVIEFFDGGQVSLTNDAHSFLLLPMKEE